MSLVAYGNSDSSDLEDDLDESVTVVPSQKKVEELTASTAQQPTETKESEDNSLFNHLPQPTSKNPTVVEEDDEFLHKKEDSTNIVKPKAKITVPSLSDFKDIEDKRVAKPKTSNGKKSGLLSLLPQPKNGVTISSKSLIPNVIAQKPNLTAKKKVLPSPLKKTKAEPDSLTKSYSDESDDDEVQNDFFSINKPVDLPVDAPLDIDLPIKKQIQPDSIPQQKTTRSIESYFKQDVPSLELDYSQPDTSMESSSYSDYGATEGSSTGAVLDEEAILKLCGTRGKRKREEIQIVDVNQQEVLADAREWLLKGLMDDTTKRVSSSKKKGNEPTSQQRRKHQITYLAHQAKANEAELQNQWANNRMTKRQTQSKYGF